MIDSNHPITPPKNIIDKWEHTWLITKVKDCGLVDYIATMAARWGADTELEACSSWVSQFDYDDYSYGDSLRSARHRPKPPSLKAQALVLIDTVEISQDACSSWDFSVIRRALESLPD